MKFAAVTSLALAGASSAAYTNGTASAVYITDVVTAYTTYCPAATSIVMNGQTYTASEATTLTITDCPCTIITRSSSLAADAVAAASSTPAVATDAAVSTAVAVVTNAVAVAVAASYSSVGSSGISSSSDSASSPSSPSASQSIVSNNATATAYKPVVYTGTADHVAVAPGLFAVVGAVAAAVFL